MLLDQTIESHRTASGSQQRTRTSPGLQARPADAHIDLTIREREVLGWQAKAYPIRESLRPSEFHPALSPGILKIAIRNMA